MGAELYEVLGLKLEGIGLTAVREVQEGDGYEVWRKLVKGFSPKTHAVVLREMVGLMVPGAVEKEKDIPRRLGE